MDPANIFWDRRSHLDTQNGKNHPKRKAAVWKHSPPAVRTGRKTLLPIFPYLLAYLSSFCSIEKPQVSCRGISAARVHMTKTRGMSSPASSALPSPALAQETAPLRGDKPTATSFLLSQAQLMFAQFPS